MIPTCQPVWRKIRKIAPISAQELVSRLEFDQVFPVDVFALAENLEIRVEENDASADGCLIIEGDPEVATIQVSSYVADVRKRLTVAHEIGHLALGHKFTQQGNRKVSPDRPWNVEREANKFASELLMPDNRLRIVFNALPLLVDMANYFGVSEEALIYRLRELRLIST